MIKESFTYITKVEDCPYCLEKIKFHSLSKESVRDSIKQLYEHMNSHFGECKFRKLNDEKQLVKISINTKKISEKLYSSCFDTHQILVG